MFINEIIKKRKRKRKNSNEGIYTEKDIYMCISEDIQVKYIHSFKIIYF